MSGVLKLARSDGLTDLKNRESVYAKALDGLISKGLESAQDSDCHQADWTEETVACELRNIAWRTLEAEGSAANAVAGNFTGVFAGAAFEKFKQDNKSLLAPLGQIDVTTWESLFDKPGFRSLAWRHFSFCEYFAGAYLACLPQEQREPILQRHARDPRWRWILRFALSWAEREKKSKTLVQLATDLIRYGNPFLLYDALSEDRVVLQGLEQPLDLDRLCRWLVHRDWGPDRYYSQAWNSTWPRPTVVGGTLDILESLFRREYRNSRCLHPAWELLESSTDPRGAAIRRDFLSEFERIRLHSPDDLARQTAGCLVTGFVRCPRDKQEDRKPFLMGTSVHDLAGGPEERPQHAVIMTPFELAATPVTNIQFELFDPSHAFLRDQYSPDDQCPVVHVNWYMATAFCLWLGPGYRLPTEAEWEYACRAGTRTRYNTGDRESDLDRAGWYDENSAGRTQPVKRKLANAWGLYDMHGNVWEWCWDWFDEYDANAGKVAVDPHGPPKGVNRVVRGGGWRYDGRFCRPASRNRDEPGFSNDDTGFRLARGWSGE